MSRTVHTDTMYYIYMLHAYTKLSSIPSRLVGTSVMEDSYTIRGLLSRIRNEENRRIKEVGALTFQLQKQKKRCQKLEAESKLERDKRKFKDNELIHIKMALGRRDDVVSKLEKELEQCKEHHVHLDELEKAERKETEIHSRLLRIESELLTSRSKIESMKKSYTILKRENIVLRAKYEQLIRSEHNASEELELQRRQLQMMKESQESQRAMYENINSRDRDDTVQTLLALGRNLPDSLTSCFKKYPTPMSHHIHAYRSTLSCSEDDEDDAASL